MKTENTSTIYSATDLANFLGCRHATSLDVAALSGDVEKIYRHDSTLELLIELQQMREENERLRELVEVIYECGDISPNLWDRIVEEVGDE